VGRGTREVEPARGAAEAPTPGEAPPPAGGGPAPSQTRRRRRRAVAVRWRNTIALAGPGFAWTLLFFLAPLGVLVFYSFGQIDTITLQPSWGWTLDNYQRIGESLYTSALLRSLWLSLTATGLCLLIGYPVAYWMSTLTPRWQRILLLLIIVPWWTSFLVRTYAIAGLLANGGALEDVLRTLGLVDGSLNLLNTRGAVAIGIVYSYLPLMVLPLYVALERVDDTLRQVASDLGASPARVFTRVVLPLSMPGIVAGCLLVGIPATGEYVIPTILGGGKTLMISNVISDQFIEVGDYSFGSALAVTLMAGVTIMALIGRRFSRESEDIL
jgi:spermidine/putrescine transport system permease protein